MSEENVEVVRALIDAVNRGDPEAFIACLSADVEWQQVSPGREDPFRLQAIYRGRTEARQWFVETILEPWESFHVETEQITATGDDRVFHGWLLTARGRALGVETEVHAWQVFWCADGKITRRRPYGQRAEALEAAGLSE